MPVVVTTLAASAAAGLALLCFWGDYPWEWLVMNPFTGAVGGYIGMALRSWIRESRDS